MSDYQPVPPLIVGRASEDDDLALFASEEALEGYLRPEQVFPDLEAYDSRGRRLDVLVEDGSRRLLRRTGKVSVVLAAEQPEDESELFERMRRFLDGIGDPPLHEATLPELLERAVKVAGYTGS